MFIAGYPMTLGKKILYALGQFGWTLCAFGVGKLLVTFYVTGTAEGGYGFPVLIYQRYIFGFFTVIGLILAFTRIFDAAASLFSASICDRNRLKHGRRTGMMAIAVAPFALLSVALFMPPSTDDFYLNSIWLMIGISVYYLFMALYGIPYTAMLTELGRSVRERLQLTTAQAFASGAGFLLGTSVWRLMQAAESVLGLAPVSAFRLVLGGFAVIGVISMILPIIFLRTPSPSGDSPAERLPQSALLVLGDRNFRGFALADCMYWAINTTILTGFFYYATVLLKLAETDVLFLTRIMFLCSFLFYFPVYRLAQALGKRKLLFIAFMIFAVLFALAIFIGKYPGSAFAQALLLVILFSIPVSIFAVVPNAVVADIAVSAEIRTGIQRPGMYFGVRSFVMKMAQMIATLLFPTLMLIGSRGDGEAGRLGLRITLLMAALFSVVGFISLFGYREKEVRSVLEHREAARSPGRVER